MWRHDRGDARGGALAPARLASRRRPARDSTCGSTTTTRCRRSPAAAGRPGTTTPSTSRSRRWRRSPRGCPSRRSRVEMGPLSFARGADLRPLLDGLVFDRVGTSYDEAVLGPLRRGGRSEVEDGPYAVGEVSFHGAAVLPHRRPQRHDAAAPRARDDVLRRRRAGRWTRRRWSAAPGRSSCPARCPAARPPPRSIPSSVTARSFDPTFAARARMTGMTTSTQPNKPGVTR